MRAARAAMPRRIVTSTSQFAGRVAGLLAVLALSGCAPAYNSYRDGCVPYNHCPPPPLPYTSYSGCPTPVAERYADRLTRVAFEQPVEAAFEPDAVP